MNDSIVRIKEEITERDYYDEKFLAGTLLLLKSMVKDLSMWSAYNDDKLNEEIHQLNELIYQMQTQPLSAKELEDAN